MNLVLEVAEPQRGPGQELEAREPHLPLQTENLRNPVKQKGRSMAS